MSNLQIKAMLVIFQILLLIIQILICIYVSRAKELQVEKFNRFTSISIVIATVISIIITAVVFFIFRIFIAL